MKSIIKEILIILLLCCAICLILGVIFYDYIPTNKVVPSTVEAYKTSNNIKEEFSQEIVDYPKENIVLEITDSDLKLHQQENNYNSGKINPFAVTSSNTVENTTGTVNKNTVKNNTTVTNTNPDSTDHFFNSTGLK